MDKSCIGKYLTLWWRPGNEAIVYGCLHSTCHIYYRKIRTKDVAKFHFQLCLALLGMLLFFLIGIDRNENEVLCTAMSLLIHYFSLASVMWMGAEAVLMFQKLIIIFGNLTPRYFIVSSLICWCKFIIVAAGGSFGSSSINTCQNLYLCYAVAFSRPWIVSWKRL